MTPATPRTTTSTRRNAVGANQEAFETSDGGYESGDGYDAPASAEYVPYDGLMHVQQQQEPVLGMLQPLG